MEMTVNKLFICVINLFRIFQLGETRQASQITYYELKFKQKWHFLVTNMTITYVQ